MAEAATTNPLSLSEQYLLKENEGKSAVEAKPVDAKEESVPAPAASVESVADKSVEIAEAVQEKAVETAETVAEKTVQAAEAVAAKAVEITDAVTEEKNEDTSVVTEESTVNAPAIEENGSKDSPSSSEETSESAEENTGSEEAAEEAPEIKLETAPADYRFPTTNQTRHCFTRYIEYHRCVAAKGDDAQECEKYAKYYRALCPSEWVDRWNEQRENGTFPGPL